MYALHLAKLAPGILLEPVPRDPTRDEARRELSKEMYRRHESLINQFGDWLDRVLGDLLDRVSNSPGGGGALVLVVALVVIGVVVALLVKFGPLSRTSRRRRNEAADIGPIVSEAEHRRLADAFAAEGNYAEAVRERLRAIIGSLIDRRVLDDRLGRTAAEVATDAGRALPSAAADLREAADLFGSIWYGRRTATADHDTRMRAIDKSVAAARPDPTGGDAAGAAPAWAVPSAGPSPSAGSSPRRAPSERTPS